MPYISFFTALISTLIIDGIWLGLITTSLYQKLIGHLMAPRVNFIPAMLFYPLFAAAVVVFVVTPSISSGWSNWQILARGAFLGLLAYGTYDLTNNALLKDWPASMTIIDISWGVAITAAVSLITVLVTKAL